jgi:hypothetical protein
MPSLPIPMENFVMVTINDRVYTFGGYNDGTPNYDAPNYNVSFHSSLSLSMSKV